MPIPKQRRESSRHSFVFALDAHHRSCHPKANLSYNTSDFPLELWTIIARFASRQSLARLCSLSHHFCSAFTPLLYSNTIDPPLTAPQSALLIQTLSSDVERCSCPICARAHTPVYGTPHPALATLIRDLGLVDGTKDQTFRDKPQLLKALSQLAIAQRLRSLHWSLAAGVGDLGRILGAPERFPHLKELDVSCDGTNKNFNFLLVPGLKVLQLKLDLTFLVEKSYMDWPTRTDQACYKLAESLPMLPSTSPMLHTLQLKLKIPFDDEGFPHDSYPDLVAAINGLHLSVLATLDLSVELIPDDWFEYGHEFPPDLPETDFLPCLTSHPNLSQLTLNASGTKLSEEDTFLHQLHSFQGSFQDAAVICRPPRQIQKLVLPLVYPDMTYQSLLPSYDPVLLPGCSSLTHLRLFAVDIIGKTMKKTDELSPKSFHQLATSFPNVTHLDVCISEPMIDYCAHLKLLIKLRSLRLHEYRTRRLGPPNWPSSLVFPPEDYITKFALFLPSQPQLAHIEICILGDTYPNSQDFYESQDYYIEDMMIENMGEPPELALEYLFSVLRPSSGACVVLEHARVTDRYSAISERKG